MPASNQAYTNQVLKVVVAQICQTVGFNSVQSTPMEVMIDVLHNYMRELCVLTKDYAEHYNRTEPNLDDVTLAYREMKINFSELREYMEYVDPIPFALSVPKYPIPKESHLNFLKPGSQEVLTRPMHIPEYMPPMQAEPEDEQALASQEVNVNIEEGLNNSSIKDELMLSPTAGASSSGQQPFFKKPSDFPLPPGTSADSQRRLKFDGSEGLKETREISSVIMTTSGFISPAREGKLPDSKPPIIIPDKRPSPPPPPVVVAPLTVSNMDNKFEEKPAKKQKSHDSEKKEKKKVKKELFQPPLAIVQPTPSPVPVENPIRQLPAVQPPPPLPTQQPYKPPQPQAQHFPFTDDIKPNLPIGPPSVPRKPGRPRKSESLTPGMPGLPKEKVKKPKNPDAKLIKYIKKQVAAGKLPPLDIQELLQIVKAQNAKMGLSNNPMQMQRQQPPFMAGPSGSMPNPLHSSLPGQFTPNQQQQKIHGQNINMGGPNFEGKVPSESEKSKLNIFKKMPSSSKMVHHDFPSGSMMKSEMFPGHLSEMSPQKHQKQQQFKPNDFDFPTTPVNMAMNKSMDFNRSPIDELTMPTTPQYMPRTPDVKGGSSSWSKNKDGEPKKRKEKPEKKMKKIKTPPLMPFFAGPDMQNPLNRMSIPGMPNFAQMPQASGSMQQPPRFPFFPNLIPSGPGLIPNNAFLAPFGNAQFGAPPFNMTPFIPNDIIQNLNKIRTQMDTSPVKDKFQEQLMEMKQAQCNVPPLLPPTGLDPIPRTTPPKSKNLQQQDSPPSLIKLPKDTVAIPLEPSSASSSMSINPVGSSMMSSKKVTVESLDEISVKPEYKSSGDKPSTSSINFDTVDLTSPKPDQSKEQKDEKESKKDKKLKKKNKKKDKFKDKEGTSKDKSERKKDKEERKREKKEKRREKERLAMEQNKFLSSNTDSIDNSDSSLASVPKLTLKLGVSGDSRPNTPDIPKKMTIKTTFGTKKKESDSDIGSSPLQMTISSNQRESSPELAKFSALVTHPPKQKSSHKRKHDEDVFSGDDSKSSSKHMKSPSSGSEVKKHKKSTPQPSTSTSNPSTRPPQMPSSSRVEEEQEIWICPACGQVDNGTPMIGCDGGCDAWYHWVCVGIQVPPDDNENWYCRVCISRKQNSHGSEKKKKRKKNKEKGDKA